MKYLASKRYLGLLLLISTQFGCTSSALVSVSSAPAPAPVRGAAQCTESANIAVSAAVLRDLGKPRGEALAQLVRSDPGDMVQSGVNSAYYFKDLAGYPLFSMENLFCLANTNNPNGVPDVQIMLLRAHREKAVECQNLGLIERDAFLACANNTQGSRSQ